MFCVFTREKTSVMSTKWLVWQIHLWSAAHSIEDCKALWAKFMILGCMNETDITAGAINFSTGSIQDCLPHSHETFPNRANMAVYSCSKIFCLNMFLNLYTLIKFTGFCFCLVCYCGSPAYLPLAHDLHHFTSWPCAFIINLKTPFAFHRALSYPRQSCFHTFSHFVQPMTQRFALPCY